MEILPQLTGLLGVVMASGVSTLIIILKNNKIEKKLDVHTLDNVIQFKGINTRLDEGEDIINPMRENKNLYRKLATVSEKAMEYRKDGRIAAYNNAVASGLVSFSRDIMDIDINKISDVLIDSKSHFEIQKCHSLFKEYWGEDLLKKYVEQTKKLRREYIKKVKNISEEVFNSKAEAYRSITFLYMRQITKAFMDFYDGEKLEEL